MKIAVIGTGYVGLVTGTCFAETGNTVTCVDIDPAKVASLSGGKMTIYEPGLDVLFERNIKQGRLSFTTNLKEGIKDAQTLSMYWAWQNNLANCSKPMRSSLTRARYPLGRQNASPKKSGEKQRL